MFNQKPPVTAHNARLILFVGVMAIILVMGIFMVRGQMNQKKVIVNSQLDRSVDVSTAGEESTWFNDEKFKHIKINGRVNEKPTASDIKRQIMSAEEIALQKQEIEDAYAARLEMAKLEDKNLVEAKKLEMAAGQSPLTIDIPGPPGVSVSASDKKKSARDDFNNQINELMTEAQSVVAMKLPGLMGMPAIGNVNNQDAKQAFLKNLTPENDDYLKNTKTKPRSRYEIKAGTYIPSALITGINSDLPGSVSAQVTDNVYDTVSGNYLLIPQGTRLTGEYNSQLAMGQARVQVIWNRLIFPDGQSLNLERMQGVDNAGYTGLYDKVNNHYVRIYGNAILLSLMGAGYDLLADHNNHNAYHGQLSAQEAMASRVGEKMSAVTDKTLERNMDIQPTLTIGPGYKFKIFVMKDIVLEPIKNAEGTLAYTE